MSVFDDNVKEGDILRASTYQSLLNFAKGSSVAGGTTSADGISIPSEYERSPRTVRFIAKESLLTETHKHWRINLNGTSKNDPNDKGSPSYGRLFEAFFRVNRHVSTHHEVSNPENTVHYTFSATVNNYWEVNQSTPISVALALSPAVSGGTLFYKPSSSTTWENVGAFTDQRNFSISSRDLKYVVDGDTMRYNSSFDFMVRKEETVIATLTLKRPKYTFRPATPPSYEVLEQKRVAEANGQRMTVLPRHIGLHDGLQTLRSMSKGMIDSLIKSYAPEWLTVFL